jgi:two-component system chemotaxis response regulator CheB
MPVMDGLTALPRILEENPKTRVIMLSTLTTGGAKASIQALALGAADYIPKPTTLQGGKGLETIETELLSKIRALGTRKGSFRSTAKPPAKPPILPKMTTPRVLIIGSSTGGPNALEEVLSGLPGNFPLPILIVQHMPPIFTAYLAERLDKRTELSGQEAKDGDIPQPGNIYMAPGGHHMVIQKKGEQAAIFINQDPPENFCRPAVDPLFRSVAKYHGTGVIGLILTGMGEDGRRGSEEVVKRGGIIIAQDEDTSVVWGMPGAVVQAGLASEVLPISKISSHIMSYCEVLV